MSDSLSLPIFEESSLRQQSPTPDIVRDPFIASNITNIQIENFLDVASVGTNSMTKPGENSLRHADQLFVALLDSIDDESVPIDNNDPDDNHHKKTGQVEQFPLPKKRIRFAFARRKLLAYSTFFLLTAVRLMESMAD